MICPKCGAENQDSSKFCLKCGAKLQIEGEKKQRKINLPVLIVAGILVLILIAAAVIVSLKSSEDNREVELPDSEDIFDERDAIRLMQDSNDAQLIADEYVSNINEDDFYSYYSIIDIDEDGIPELIAAEERTDTESDKYSSDVNFVNYADVYTYDYNTYSIVYAGTIGEDTPLCVGKNDGQLRSARIDSDLIEYTYYTLYEVGEIATTTYTYDIEKGKLYEGEAGVMTESAPLSSEEEEAVLDDWKDAYYIDFAENVIDQESDSDAEEDSGELIVDTDDTETDAETETSLDTEEASTEDSYIDMDDDESQVELFDYANCLDLSNYNYVETDYFSFYCPTDFYEDHYVTDTHCVYSQDRENGEEDSVGFFVQTYEEAGYEEDWSADEIAQQLIDDFSFNSDQIEILLNNSTDEESDGCARVAISGRDVGGNNRYDAYTIDDNYIYTMSICSRPSSSDEEANWENYYIDCLYRGCSFTRDVGEMDTYEDYLERS